MASELMEMKAITASIGFPLASVGSPGRGFYKSLIKRVKIEF